MPLQITYETPSTGAQAAYHVVSNVVLDYEMTMMTVSVASYLSRDAKDAGKFAMYAQQIQITGLPDQGVDPRTFAESALAAAAPTDASGSPSFNRYAFAGADIVH